MKKILRHRFSSALLLVIIYGLQLGMFNLMMEATFQIRNDQALSCTQHTNSKNSTHQPLAAFYQSVLKHEDAKKHHFAYRALDFNFLVKLFIAPGQQPSGPGIAEVRPVYSFHLPDDTFKRYRLINVFLI